MLWRAAAARRETFSLPIWVAWSPGLTTVEKDRDVRRPCSVYTLLFETRSQSSPGWPITHCTDQADLKFRDRVLASWVLLGLKVYTVTPVQLYTFTYTCCLSHAVVPPFIRKWSQNREERVFRTGQMAQWVKIPRTYRVEGKKLSPTDCPLAFTHVYTCIINVGFLFLFFF